MARISISDVGKFSSGSTSEFFTLKDDGDVAKVRFLYQEPDGSDIDFYLVHEVELEPNKKRYVSCIGVDEDGKKHVDDCPLCKAGYYTQEKLFLQLFDEGDEKLKVWERGKTFVQKIVTYLNRYGSLVSQPIEIERRGKAGDQKTTYEMFALEKDNKTVDDFPEKQQIEGTYIIKATKADMQDMIDGIYKLSSSGGGDSSTPKRDNAVDSLRPRGSRRRERTTDTF